MGEAFEKGRLVGEEFGSTIAEAEEGLRIMQGESPRAPLGGANLLARMPVADRAEMAQALQSRVEGILKKLPSYEDESLTSAAQSGFALGAGTGYDDAELQIVALWLGLELAQMALTGGITAAGRSAAVRNALASLAPITRASPSAAGQIAPFSSDLAIAAAEYRLNKGLTTTADAARNVVAVEYESAGVKTIRAFANEPRGPHSEEVMRQALPKDAKVLRVFSERQPCLSPGHQCSELLAENYPGAKVTWYAGYRGRADQLIAQRSLQKILSILRNSSTPEP